jgi:hypothetical protein
MSAIIELFYKCPRDPIRESQIKHEIAELRGRFDYAEETVIEGVCQTICLTFEFDDIAIAKRAAELLRQRGEHIEGPQEYST